MAVDRAMQIVSSRRTWASTQESDTEDATSMRSFGDSSPAFSAIFRAFRSSLATYQGALLSHLHRAIVDAGGLETQ